MNSFQIDTGIAFDISKNHVSASKIQLFLSNASVATFLIDFYSKLHNGEAFNISKIIFSRDFELNQSASNVQVFLSDASVSLLLEEN